MSDNNGTPQEPQPLAAEGTIATTATASNETSKPVEIEEDHQQLKATHPPSVQAAEEASAAATKINEEQRDADAKPAAVIDSPPKSPVDEEDATSFHSAEEEGQSDAKVHNDEKDVAVELPHPPGSPQPSQEVATKTAAAAEDQRQPHKKMEEAGEKQQESAHPADPTTEPIKMIEKDKNVLPEPKQPQVGTGHSPDGVQQTSIQAEEKGTKVSEETPPKIDAAIKAVECAKEVEQKVSEEKNEEKLKNEEPHQSQEEEEDEEEAPRRKKKEVEEDNEEEDMDEEAEDETDEVEEEDDESDEEEEEKQQKDEKETEEEQKEDKTNKEEEELNAKEEVEEELDEDECKESPAYIPKQGRFYMHDEASARSVVVRHKPAQLQMMIDTIADDVEAGLAVEAKKELNEETETDEDSVLQKMESESVEKGGSDEPKTRADRVSRWSHDMFNERSQAPKNSRDLVRHYGRDIRRPEDETDENEQEEERRGGGQQREVRRGGQRRSEPTSYGRSRGGGNRGRVLRSGRVITRTITPADDEDYRASDKPGGPRRSAGGGQQPARRFGRYSTGDTSDEPTAPRNDDGFNAHRRQGRQREEQNGRDEWEAGDGGWEGHGHGEVENRRKPMRSPPRRGPPPRQGRHQSPPPPMQNRRFAGDDSSGAYRNQQQKSFQQRPRPPYQQREDRGGNEFYHNYEAAERSPPPRRMGRDVGQQQRGGGGGGGYRQQSQRSYDSRQYEDPQEKHYQQQTDNGEGEEEEDMGGFGRPLRTQGPPVRDGRFSAAADGQQPPPRQHQGREGRYPPAQQQQRSGGPRGPPGGGGRGGGGYGGGGGRYGNSGGAPPRRSPMGNHHGGIDQQRLYPHPRQPTEPVVFDPVEQETRRAQPLPSRQRRPLPIHPPREG